MSQAALGLVWLSLLWVCWALHFRALPFVLFCLMCLLL